MSIPHVKKLLVTGGAGFIGSELVRQLIRETDSIVVNVDKLTYAGSLDSLQSVASSPRYHFERVDVCDGAEVQRLFHQYQPDAIMHLAAESHVDRSIDGSAEFIQTNIVGTYTLLEQALRYWHTLDGPKKEGFRFLHVSTDEVYGSLGDTGLFVEGAPYAPNSPYAATKASSDHLVRAWRQTYGLPVITTHCSNNYGPHQFPEKLIPSMILNAVAGKPLPVYGQGGNVRDWLHVADHARALCLVLDKGAPGEVYNIGGNSEMTNLEVIKTICTHLDELVPRRPGSAKQYQELITFVTDRPGHDHRYAVDFAKVRRELGWAPKETFESGIAKTVEWYLANRDWCEQATAVEMAPP